MVVRLTVFVYLNMLEVSEKEIDTRDDSIL